MSTLKGHILTDDVVVNYTKRDRDDCLHFLTSIDPTCHDLAALISPTAKRVFTSKFNAWFLRMNFDVKNIIVKGFSTNKSYQLTFKGNKYIYSFIDSKFSAGSVALLLHGTFGSYLYTGNFSCCSAFLSSPVLRPIIKEKAITRLYLDNTYYEQPSNFLGFDEIVSSVIKLIKSEPTKNFYIHSERVTMDPIIAEIVSKLEEKVYVSESTLELMKFLECESFFTRDSSEARIFINKTIKKCINFENHTTVNLHRYSDQCKFFKKIEKMGNVYDFNFYCHSNHKEICTLLELLKPESMTFIYSEIEKPIFSHNTNHTCGLSPAFLSKGVLTKPSVIVERSTNKVTKIPGQFMKPTIINNNPGTSKALSNKRTITIPKNRDLNTNNGDKNLAHRSSVNPGVIQLPSLEYSCPFRDLDVSKINSAGPSKKSNFTNEDGDNSAENSTYHIQLNDNGIKKINSFNKTTPTLSVQSHTSPEVLNHYKHKPKQFLNLIKLQDNTSGRNTLKSNNLKSLSPIIVNGKVGMPLIKENRFNRTNSKLMQLSNNSNSHNSDHTKKIIIIKEPKSDVEKMLPTTVSPNDTQNTKVLNHIEKERLEVNDTVMLRESGMCDTNLNIEPTVLNVSECTLDSKDNNSISSESEIKQPEASRKGKILHSPIDENKNSDLLPDSVELQLDRDIQQHATGSKLQENCNNIITSNTSLAGNETNDKINHHSSELEPLDKRIDREKKSEINKSTPSKDTCNNAVKRCLSDDESEQLRKKLRSDNIAQSLLQSKCQEKQPVSSRKDCSVVVIRNGFKRSYFYSKEHKCYLPIFCGFKKNELRPRTMLNTLRILQKHSKD